MYAHQELLERVITAENIIRDTPIIHLESSVDDHVELFAKLEFFNGIGSVKDRPALWILKRAIERGEVGPETTVIESSSGNFACALSVFCRMLGLRFVPVIDPNISELYEQTLRCNCERVVKVTDRDDTGGYLKTRLTKVQELVDSYDDCYWPNQYENTDAIAAHFHLTGGEILKVPLDYVFLGVSTGGTIAGVSQRLKQANPSIKVIAVDVEGSVIFGGPSKRRCLPGLGSSISPALVKQALIDEVMMVSELDTIVGCRDLLERHGLFVGASTGTVYSAIKRYFAGWNGQPRPRALFLCCDRGAAYLQNVFDPDWAIWRARIDQEDAEAVNG